MNFKAFSGVVEFGEGIMGALFSLFDVQDAPEQGFRAQLRQILSSWRFENIIIWLILINAIMLGLETDDGMRTALSPWLEQVDTVIISIFVVEILLRIFAFGSQFWRDPWSVFDFAVVSVTLIPATGNLSVLRAFRILRALRLISGVESMRRVVSGLLSALPGMGSISMLLVLILYVSAVMATKLFGATVPEFFGNLGTSTFSLFKVMTLEGWPDIADAVMEKHPWAWLFFVIYILVTAFAVLNLFIGIIVDAMQPQNQATLAAVEETDHDVDEVLVELRALRREVRALRGEGSD